MINKRKDSFYFLLQLLIFISTIAIMIEFDKNSSIYLVIIFIVVSLLYKYVIKNSISHRELICIGFFSILFSEAIVLGNRVNYEFIYSGKSDNYIELDVCAIMSGIALACALFPLLIIICKFVMNTSISDENLCDKIQFRFFFTSWFFIFIMWMPYLLSFYPGGVVGDGAETLELALKGGIPESNHWVVFYILFLRLFLNIGKIFTEDINFGVFLYTLFEMCIFSAVCAWIATKLRQKGLNKIGSWLCVCVYAFSGFFASYSISLWKDALFSACVILISLLLWDILDKKCVTIFDTIRFALLCLFLCFWRNNGIHILIVTLIMVFLVYNRNIKFLKKIFLAGIIVIIITSVIQGPIYDELGIGKDTVVESISIPLQQIAATINEGVELSNDQKEVLFSILPQEQWIQFYYPTSSDWLKMSLDGEYLSTHMSDFIKIWLQLLIPNFGTYVKAYLMEVLGFWQPGVYVGGYFDYFIGIEDIYNRGWINTNIISDILGINIDNILLNRMEFIPSGTSVWILFFSLSLIFTQECERKKKIVILLPLLASWIIVMLSSPMAYLYRYILMIPMALPIIIYLPFIGNKKVINNKEVDFETNRKKKSIGVLVAIFIGIGSIWLNIFSDIQVIEKYTGKKMEIYTAGENYNASDYFTLGCLANEGESSWTSGKEMKIEVPVSRNICGTVNISINVKGTFNGKQRYIVKQNNNIIIEGELDSEGKIIFEANIIDHNIKFEVLMPDAIKVNEVIKDSDDSREVAFLIDKISLLEK